MWPAVSSCGHDPWAIVCKGAMAQQAVRCPSVQVSPGNGRGQVLGAEPLCLPVAAQLGDAMEGTCPQGQRSCARGTGWCIRGWERFLSELTLAGKKPHQGHIPSADRG